ncbi:OsmC family peroxiredoxin [Actinocrispum wychmicini]|uniref:Osmotically inducible protein OsmC n=1 Tax=Actinocrispum wychmicini TaxID=1213861 RepID=A0A4R2IWU8_9PSEU|nr:OsmC family peroxiredoxin [Actinocrispum wychmicini]TCO47405.1 osmotically inducible protein OsmC [Actinocrispum wychmicini]
MLHVRKTSRARWQGPASTGSGTLSLGRRGPDLPFSLRSRVGDEPATNPEELLGSALAGCFAMSLANLCEERGTPAESIDATALVHLVQTDEGFRIPTIELSCTVSVPGLADEVVRELAEQAERTCPVRLLYNADVTLKVEVS